MDVVHPAQLKANSRKKKQKLLTGFDSGENYRLVCKAIVFGISFSFERKVEKVTHIRDTRDKIARLTRENPPRIELFALCEQRSQ